MVDKVYEMNEEIRLVTDLIERAIQRREDKIAELKSLLSRCEEVLLPFATASGWILEDGKTLGETSCFKAKAFLSELKTLSRSSMHLEFKR